MQADPDNGSAGNCFHCGLPLPEQASFTATVGGEPRHFCCFGCQSVCQAIYESGLEGFYQRTPDGELLAPPPEPPKDVALYDLDEIQEEFIHRSGTSREINLLVEGIHCAACVWLIERTLGQINGILGANVNLSGRRLLLRWDNDRIRLSDIIRRLGEIGYSAVPFDPEAAEGRLKRQNRTMLFRIALAGFAMMNLLWISIALYSGADIADEGQFRSLFHWIGFGLASLTLFISGWPFLRGAWTGLRNLHLTMDLPIAIGATVTYLYSSYVTVTGSPLGEVYFDTVVNFIFVILVGRHLEGASKRHAVAATQRLMDLQPKVATLLVEGAERVAPIRTVKLGDTVLVKAGAKIPVDGTILEGETSVDESMLSGESEPVQRRCGDAVSAGTINRGSAITLRVTATLQNTSLGRIIQLVEEAQASKAPIQCIADRIVPWFVLVTLLLASATFLFWYGSGFELALMAATSVLIITCPCAFGLATPMAIAVATGQGARHGVLVKNGEVLETLSRIDHVVFDKTGTLTRGEMSVQQLVTTDAINHGEVLRHAAAIERFSQHGIAGAITRYAEAEGLLDAALLPEKFVERSGYGIRAEAGGRQVVIGTEAWLQENGVEADPALQRQAAEWSQRAIGAVHVALDGRHAALFAVADQLRPDAAEVVDELRRSGIRLTLLSGDRRPVAEALAEQLGGMEVIAEVLPEQKEAEIRRLQEGGSWVAMVGDGINDAPALMRANVGIAVGSGTDVSIECADIVLMNDELRSVHLATALSRRALMTIRQNIGISITYNVIMVPLAMSALITPLIAAISMPISSLLVIGNAARIRTLFK